MLECPLHNSRAAAPRRTGVIRPGHAPEARAPGRRARTPPAGDAAKSSDAAGFALLFCVVFVLAITGIVGALVPLAVTERLLSAAAREAAQCRFAAAAVVNHAIAELQALPGWDSALDGTVTAPFADTTRAPRLTASRTLDLDAVAAAFRPLEPGAWGANTPQWRLFAWGPAERLAPGNGRSRIYVAVWIADDEGDGDGQPARDSNGLIRLRGEAFGPVAAHAAVVGSVRRDAPAPAALRLIDWRVP